MRSGRTAARRGRTCAAGGVRPRAAFTLIEILVVISVIALLIGAIAFAGVGIMRRQKVEMTKNIMRTTLMAIEQFAEADPLKSLYDAKGKETFGPYPPYQLTLRNGTPTGVANVVEPGNPFAALADRFERDFPTGSWYFEPGDAANSARDDNRALYTYMKTLTPVALQQIPEKAMHALIPAAANGPERINPTSRASGSLTLGTPGLVDILGIHDAWDVPLDYFLYVKLEYAPNPANQGIWRVTERKPALRSLGIAREEYDAEVAGTDAPDPGKWIFSDPFPLPAANPNNTAFRKTGVLPGNSDNGRAPGWARAIGAGDLNAALNQDDPGLFGYVP